MISKKREFLDLITIEEANAVAKRKVDISIGIKAYTELVGIDFIPLVKEECDLLVWNISRKNHTKEKLLNLLKSTEFRQKIDKTIKNIEWSS